ncbi:MAG: DUF421 domain-containing protein [Oscillospiraceae bacterium]|nr:DUF421 domain-containing protein [Oscillospiraceae bacterium]
MIITLIRTVILYVFLIVAVRLMGRRQVGELQPGELVVTILLSQIASQPICDTDIPLVYSLVPFLILVALELFMSVFSMKSIKFRELYQGSALVLIRDGVLDQKQVKRLRFTMDDVMEALRQKDVFDISDVQYAIAETDGTLSVLLKPQKRNVTNEDMRVQAPDAALPCIIISDGRVIEKNFADCNMDYKKLEKALANAHTRAENIMLMTADKSGNTYIIEKEEEGQ